MKNIVKALAIGWLLWIVVDFGDWGSKWTSSLDYMPRRDSDQENYYDDYERGNFRGNSDDQGQYHSLEAVSRGGRGGRRGGGDGGDGGQTLEYRGRSSRTGRFVRR